MSLIGADGAGEQGKEVVMPAQRKVPSGYILQRWVDAGMTHQQIADRITKESGEPVTRSAVTTALSREGLTKRVRYDETIPWRVRMKHQHSSHLWMLRVHHRTTNGGKVSEDEAARYESWKAKLDENDAVIMYVSDSPDGFYVVPRMPGDGEVITRRPKETVSSRARTRGSY